MSNSKSAWHWAVGTTLVVAVAMAVVSIAAVLAVFSASLPGWANLLLSILIVCGAGLITCFSWQRQEKLSQLLEVANREIQTLQQSHDATAEQIVSLEQRVSNANLEQLQLTEKLAAADKHANEESEKSKQQAKEQSELMTKLQAQTGIIDKQAEELTKQLKTVTDRIAPLSNQVSMISRIIGFTLGQSRDVPDAPTMEWLDETFNAVGHRLGGNNNLLYMNHSRRFSRAAAESIAEYWGPRLDLELTVESVGYVADRICQIERKSMGRIAGHIDDAVVRALVLQANKNETTDFLEIGSLFGVNALALMDLALPHFKRAHCTAIDPLNGYYGEKVADIATGLPINKSIFVHNFRSHGFSEQDYELIQAFSTDAEIIERFSPNSFDFIFIDGDHTYAGVKNDFDNYHRAVKAGGYIVFDDYGSPGWEDVKKYVDSEVMTSEVVEEVGTFAATAVFRKI